MNIEIVIRTGKSACQNHKSFKTIASIMIVGWWLSHIINCPHNSVRHIRQMTFVQSMLLIIPWRPHLSSCASYRRTMSWLVGLHKNSLTYNQIIALQKYSKLSREVLSYIANIHLIHQERHRCKLTNSWSAFLNGRKTLFSLKSQHSWNHFTWKFISPTILKKICLLVIEMRSKRIYVILWVFEEVVVH